MIACITLDVKEICVSSLLHFPMSCVTMWSLSVQCHQVLYGYTSRLTHSQRSLVCVVPKTFIEGELKESCNCICLEQRSLYIIQNTPALFVYDSYSIQSSELYIERKSVKYKYGDHLQCRVFVFGQNLL